MSCEQNVSVGAYVLGALDPGERSDFEQHLPTCAACTGELADLAGLPGLLGRLSLAEAEAAGTPTPPRVLTGLLARAHRRRQRRLRLAGAAAALIIVVGIGTGVGITANQHSPQPTRVTASLGPVHADATITAAAAGVRVDLQLSGVPSRLPCRLVVVGTHGQQVDAGTWYASYDGMAGVRETAALDRDQVAALRVETTSGRLLVSIPVAGA